MITGKNESKIKIKKTYHANENVDLMGKNVIQIRGGIMIALHHNDCIWNLATCSCQNGKYLASIMGDPAIICYEIIEETVQTNFNGKKQP